MSNAERSKRSKRKFSITPIEITEADVAASQSVVDRLMGRTAEPSPQPAEKPASTIPAVETVPAERTVITVKTVPTQRTVSTERTVPVRTTVPSEDPEPSPTTTLLTETTVPAARTVPAQGIVLPTLKVEPRDGYLQVPNTFVDSLLPQLDSNEQLVMGRLFRLSYGFQRETCTVSHNTLAATLKLGKTTVERTILSLRQRGLVEPLGAVLGGPLALRGNTYRITLPEGTIPAERRVPREKTVPRGRTVPTETTMKDLKENHDMGVYEIRTIAARLFEAHRGEPGFDQARLRELVVDALIGQGQSTDEATIDEAIRGMAT